MASQLLRAITFYVDSETQKNPENLILVTVVRLHSWRPSIPFALSIDARVSPPLLPPLCERHHFYHPTSSTYLLIVFSNTKTKPHNSTWAWICKVVGAATWSTLVTPMTSTREPWLISLSQMTQTVPLEIWIPWSRSMDLVKVPCWDSCFLFVKWSYGFKLVNVMIDI